MKHKKFFKFCLCFSVISTIAIVSILFCLFYFDNRFFFNTKLNGVDVSCFDKEKTIQKLQEYEFENFIITENNNNIELNTNDFVKIHINESEIDSLISSNFLSFSDIIFTFQKDIDTDKLLSFLNNINNSSERFSSENSIVYFNELELQYEVTDEKYGNKFDTKLLLNDICANIQNDTYTINLNNYYIKPTVFKDDNELNAEVQTLNKQFETVIEYELPDNETLIINKEKFKNWFYYENNELQFNDTLIDLFLSELDKDISTVSTNQSFIKTNGEKITISGAYGWKLSLDKEKEKLKEELLSGQTIKRRPIFKQQGLTYSKDIGSTYIEVDIDNQHMYYYKDGELFLESDVVTGTANKRYHTLTGLFYIFDINGQRYLTGQNYRTFVNCFMPFTFDGQGFHDATWRSSFGGNIYEYSGSHGCVNMPLEKALKLYENIKLYTPVIVYSDKYGHFDE